MTEFRTPRDEMELHDMLSRMSPCLLNRAVATTDPIFVAPLFGWTVRTSIASGLVSLFCRRKDIPLADWWEQFTTAHPFANPDTVELE